MAAHLPPGEAPMADERDPRDDAESEDASPELVHDDIVKRLLDYQRQLRESGPEGEAPAAFI